MIVRLNLKKIYTYLIVFLMLYTSDSVYTYVYSNYDHAIEILADMLMIMGVFSLSREVIKNILIVNGVIALVLSFLSLVCSAGSELFFLGALLIRIIAVSVFVEWCYECNSDYISSMCEIICIMAVVYLICYCLFDIGLFNIRPKVAYINMWNARKIRNIAYGCYWGFYYRWDYTRILLGHHVNACNGFFREVGVYQIYLNFALFWYFFVKKASKMRCLILIVAILSTFSTMGYVILAIQLVIKNMKHTKNGIILSVLFTCIILPVIYKVFTDKIYNYSSSRQANLKLALERILAHPFFGNGYKRELTTVYGFANYFVNWGIVGLIPIWIFVKGNILRGFTKEGKGVLAFLGWWFLSLMNEAAGYNMVFLSLYVVAFICIVRHVKYYDVLGFDGEEQVSGNR